MRRCINSVPASVLLELVTVVASWRKLFFRQTLLKVTYTILWINGRGLWHCHSHWQIYDFTNHIIIWSIIYYLRFFQVDEKMLLHLHKICIHHSNPNFERPSKEKCLSFINTWESVNSLCQDPVQRGRIVKTRAPFVPFLKICTMFTTSKCLR